MTKRKKNPNHDKSRQRQMVMVVNPLKGKVQWIEDPNWKPPAQVPQPRGNVLAKQKPRQVGKKGGKR